MLDAISARDIAVSGLRAQRVRMNFIANNIANAETTRTQDGGGAFRRQLVVLRAGELKAGAKPEQVGVHVKKIMIPLPCAKFLTQAILMPTRTAT